MYRYRFSLLHPTARPAAWRRIFEAWQKAADQPELVEYILVCDRRWGFLDLPEESPNRRPGGFARTLALWNTGRRCHVDSANIAAAYTRADVLIQIADDQFPAPHWDTELVRLMTLQNVMDADHHEFVIEVSTGTTAEHERGIFVLPIVSRARYDRLGYLFYPGYESMYADNDLCAHARKDGCVLNGRYLDFPHRHPLMDRTIPVDAVYQATSRQEAYELGARVYEARQAAGFGEVRSIAPAAEAVAPAKKPRLAVLLPGEVFSAAVMGNWTTLLAELFQVFDLDIQFGESSNVYFTRQALWDALKMPAKPRPDYVLWIDDDQVLTVDRLKLLFADLEADPALDGVFGWAWCEPNSYAASTPMLSCGGWRPDGRVVRFTYEALMEGSQDLKPVSYSGFPAALLRGRVLDQAGERAFLPIFDEEAYPPYGMGGEDASFTRRCVEQGLKFVVDRRVKVPHLKLRCAEPVEATSLEGRLAQTQKG